MMKKKIAWIITSIFIMTWAMSCGKYNEIVDADYPETVIYMPAAAGIFNLTLPNNTYETPTPGEPYRFWLDESAGKVVVPIGIRRGGISQEGEVSITIINRSDSVTTLIEQEAVTATLFPTDRYTVPTTVSLASGEEVVTFYLELDLAYVRDVSDTFALGIGIESTPFKTNPNRNTTVITFDTEIFKL